MPTPTTPLVRMIHQFGEPMCPVDDAAAIAMEFAIHREAGNCEGMSQMVELMREKLGTGHRLTFRDCDIRAFITSHPMCLSRDDLAAKGITIKIA